MLIEFLDEFVFGAREAAWPLLRDDLGLTYAQIGWLLGIPSFVGNLVEPVLGILSDVWRRRVLVLGGGVVFGGALLLTASSRDFAPLLISFVLLSPASGAFVSLSQAALMDLDPSRREQNMARWTLAGSVGVVFGPLALSGAATLGIGWRGVFVAFAALAFGMVAAVWRVPYDSRASSAGGPPDFSADAFRRGLVAAVGALKRREVMRWLALLEFSDLMLDILLGFLALYMVDVAGATPAQAATAVAVWSGVGLLGDLLLIPLLERVRGLDYLRISVALELFLYPCLLMIPTLWVKFALLGLLGLFNSGWYSILQARLYAELPGQSGTALAVKNVSGLVGGLIPLGLGLVAEQVGLGSAMWCLLLGPIVLALGLPRGSQATGPG